MQAPVPPVIQAAIAGWTIGQQVLRLNPLQAGIFVGAAAFPLLMRRRWIPLVAGALATAAGLRAEHIIRTRTVVVLAPVNDTDSTSGVTI